jgi:hypothetical protein
VTKLGKRVLKRAIQTVINVRNEAKYCQSGVSFSGSDPILNIIGENRERPFFGKDIRCLDSAILPFVGGSIHHPQLSGIEEAPVYFREAAFHLSG